MLTYTPLADAVIANLDRDPRIPESLEIAVAVDDGRLGVGEERSRQIEREALHRLRSIAGASARAA